jgi:hypothetical protein
LIKSIITAAILTMVITLPSLALSQSIDLKGQLWGGGILGDDPAEGRSSVETQLGYIPTISFYRPLNDERLLDMEWAYRVSRAYSGEVLLASAEKPYRGWIRYSTQRVEARLGLQKIAFGPAQFLRPTSWFDTLDLRDPTGQTDGVEAFRLRLFPSGSVALWSWIINSEKDTLSYGGRMELSTTSGEWGMTFHQDPLISPQQVGLFPVVMPGPHKRAALDYRYDGFIGFWFEGATLFSDNANFSGNNRYTLATLGGDFTIPLFTGILIMSESMHIRSSQNNSYTDDQTYSFFMASMPLGFLHQLMAITYIDWTSERMFHFFRWGITFDNLSVNLLLSANPKRVEYDVSEEYLPRSLAGFGNGLQLMLIYNH